MIYLHICCDLSFSQLKRKKTTKDERTQYGTVDKQQICGSTSISLVMSKNWAYPPTARGSYGR